MIDSKNDQREPTLETIDDLARRASELLSRLQQREEELSGSMERARNALEEASGTLEQANQARESAEDSAREVERLKASLEEDRSGIAELAEQCRGLRSDLEARHRELAELTQQATALRTRIEHLLPGATSATLAAPFRERRRAYRAPRRTWGLVFVLALLALVPVGYLDPVTFEADPIDSASLVADLVPRLPFLVPVLCLAIFAAVRHWQAAHLEDEYAHKEVLSTSFEGYRQILGEIDSESGQKTHTLELIQRTLEALTRHPGRMDPQRGKDEPTVDGRNKARNHHHRQGENNVN